MKKFFVLLTISYLTIGFSNAQLVVQSSNSSTNKLQDIVQSLVGSGVQVSNISSNLPLGSPLYGTFQENSGLLGIKEGLLMTTGSVQNALGPNDTQFNSGILQGFPWDPDLEKIINPTNPNPADPNDRLTKDACVVEFDIVTTSTEISFNYIFASEEYTFYVGTTYNDAFAFLISGPGISGQKNIALIPGTTTPVTINNVNPGLNSAFYRTNISNSPLMQYNGYTVKLKATIPVMPCNTYHLKLVIADVSDEQFDSGVFIESGSFSGTEEILINSSIAPDSLHICASQFPITLQAGKNTIPNYTWTKDGVVVATGNQFENVTAAGWYKVRAYRDADCEWIDSIKIEADPAVNITIGNDTSICPGGSASLKVVASGSSGYIYGWTPTASLSDPTIPNPIATPSSATAYTVSVRSGLCLTQKSVNVSFPPPINFFATTEIDACVNAPFQLHAFGAENYLWSPAANLNDPTLAHPTAIIPSTTVFKVIGSNSCYRDSAEVTATIYPFPEAYAYGDTTICYRASTLLRVDFVSDYTYSWTPSSSLTDPTEHMTKARPLRDTDYFVTISNHGCIKKDTVHIKVMDELTSKIVLDERHFKIPHRVTLGNASIGASDYTWSVSGFDISKAFEPSYDITVENNYTVVLKTMNSLGCTAYDTIVLSAYHLFIPNLITPNQDGKNDTFEITGLSTQFNLEIYNRWGDRVYKKSNYKNEWNGEGLSDGIYYYSIYDSFLDTDYKGWVQLLR